MCGSFAWMKDLQTNRELASAVEFCLSLQKVVSGEDDCDGKDSCVFSFKVIFEEEKYCKNTF